MTNNKKKVSIIGAGFVGSGIAYALTLKNIADEIVLIDINKDLANAEILDIQHGISDIGDTKIINGDYCDIVDSDLIILTAGRNRKDGETRLDLTADNTRITQGIVRNIKEYYNGGIVLVVSNPVDIITYFVTKQLGLKRGMVFGSGCVLDSSRFVNVVSGYANVGLDSVEAFVIGEHGESQIPVWSNVRVKGEPISISEAEKAEVTKKVRGIGAEIISKKGRTFYGISTCVCHIADSILNNRPAKLSVTSVLEGEYDLFDVALSVPSLIDASGVKEILKIELDEKEVQELAESAKGLKNVIESLNSQNVQV